MVYRKKKSAVEEVSSSHTEYTTYLKLSPTDV